MKIIQKILFPFFSARGGGPESGFGGVIGDITDQYNAKDRGWEAYLGSLLGGRARGPVAGLEKLPGCGTCERGRGGAALTARVERVKMFALFDERPSHHGEQSDEESERDWEC